MRWELLFERPGARGWSVNIGPFAFPVAPLILFLSIAIAVVVARLVGRDAREAESAVLVMAAVGLVVARLSFVGHYLPACSDNWLKMLDFRDLGFDRVPGVVAGALVLLWIVMRRAHLRHATLVAAVVGVASWSVATAAAGTAKASELLPAVNVTDTKGEVQSLARNDGKPLVVNLWTSWCAPCRGEMPVLAEAQRNFPGVDVVFANQGESLEAVNGFLKTQALSLHNLVLDPSLAVARATGARAFPTTLFYDENGKLLAAHLGPFSRATFQQALETLYPSAAAGASR
ncbi:Thiol-disulfide oxidoreductase ResA [Paraburkholderia saeva]|nr:Thiol-disulfide oxidoreductase ResA [Paraburkholderia saeva]